MRTMKKGSLPMRRMVGYRYHQQSLQHQQHSRRPQHEYQASPSWNRRTKIQTRKAVRGLTQNPKLELQRQRTNRTESFKGLHSSRSQSGNHPPLQTAPYQPLQLRRHLTLRRTVPAASLRPKISSPTESSETLLHVPLAGKDGMTTTISLPKI